MSNSTKEVDVAFLMADLAGYTALTETMGDVEAARVITRYVEIAHDVLQPGTRLVERVGDEILIVGDDVPSVVRTATALREVIECEPLFPTVRAGMHTGKALEHDGRFLGGALNLTARVAAHASAGQILCTEPVATVAKGLSDVEWRQVGPVRFKNVADPVLIFEVLAPSRCGETSAVDPVCRMQIARETAPARLPFRNATFYFCSLACARAFAERPDDYAGT